MRPQNIIKSSNHKIQTSQLMSEYTEVQQTERSSMGSLCGTSWRGRGYLDVTGGASSQGYGHNPSRIKFLTDMTPLFERDWSIESMARGSKGGCLAGGYVGRSFASLSHWAKSAICHLACLKWQCVAACHRSAIEYWTPLCLPGWSMACHHKAPLRS